MAMVERIVIIGGGFGGLETALSLKNILKSSAAITLIDRSAFHSYIPSICEIISGKIRPRDIQIPLEIILGPAGIEFLKAEVISVNTQKRQVVVRERLIEYDYLVISCGAEKNFYDIPGVEEFSRRFRTPQDADLIRKDLNRLLRGFRRPCSLILAGAGTEGVEVAGEVIDLIRESGMEEELEAGRINVELIDSRKRMLPAFPKPVQDFAEEYLTRLGIKIATGSPIIEVGESTVVLGSGRICDMALLIWTGSIQPARLIRELGLAKDPAGWLRVTETLRSPDDERVYGIGDAVTIFTGEEPLPVPRRAFSALDQAKIVSLNIYSSLKGKKPEAFRPKRRPQLISLGKGMGILTEEKYFLTGSWVVRLKKFIERRYLMSRLTTPVTSSLISKIPGSELLYLLRMRLPVP
jgi:NADH dehydrogenase